MQKYFLVCCLFSFAICPIKSFSISSDNFGVIPNEILLNNQFFNEKMDLLKRLVGISTNQCASFFSRVNLGAQEDFLSTWLIESCKIFLPAVGIYYNASDMNWSTPDSKEYYENPWICSYSSNWAFYYPNNCSWVFDNERLTLDTLRNLDNINVSLIGRNEAASIRLKRKIASYLLFEHVIIQGEEECFNTVGRDVIEEDYQATPLVYTVQYDEEIIGLPRTVSESSAFELKPFYAHPTKPKVNMTKFNSYLGRNYKFEESFNTVGVLVSDEQEDITLPLVYTVAYDEELIYPISKEQTKILEVKDTTSELAKLKNSSDAKREEVKKYGIQDEWFRSVGVLVTDENKEEILPIVYTVKYDEELIGVKAIKNQSHENRLLHSEL